MPKESQSRRGQSRGEKRKAQILDVADRLFRGQGYAATSVRQIAEEAGFGSAVSGLYNHFPNKQAIFAELLISRSPYEALLDALQQIEGETLEAFLRQLLMTFWTVMGARLDFLQLVFIDVQEFDGQTLATFAAKVIPHLFMLLTRLHRFPELRDDLPFSVIVRTLSSAMIGSFITEIVAQQISPEVFPMPPAMGEAWVDSIVSILVRGISKQET